MQIMEDSPSNRICNIGITSLQKLERYQHIPRVEGKKKYTPKNQLPLIEK